MTPQHPRVDADTGPAEASVGRRYERELASAHRQLEDAEADRAKLLQEARHRALHDPLTGLPNRRHLEESLLASLARAGEQRNRVGVLFCDVNNFKQVNDTLGHAAGDQPLTRG